MNLLGYLLTMAAIALLFGPFIVEGTPGMALFVTIPGAVVCFILAARRLAVHARNERDKRELVLLMQMMKMAYAEEDGETTTRSREETEER